ncbi:MAG: T9SS type A sorting domain-containing protein [Ignavibacteriales bacterium]|nr:T9SS type A sorting domain-containing protein [Ignavibacteriales bacterium]
MKKFSVIIAVLIITIFLPAQQKFSSDYLKHKLNLKHQENILRENYNPFEIKLDSWIPTDLLSQMWDNNDWQNMAYTQFFYDANGKLTSDLSQSWADGAWVNNSRTTYTYEGNLQSIMESDNWENETWVPAYKTQWTYNENRRVTNIYNQTWVNSEWVTNSQDTYTYDGDNCTQLLMENWVNGAWETSHKTTYEYDAEGNNTVSISETWIFGFTITGKEINTFDQGLRITSLRQNLAGTDWMDAGRTTYSYNTNRQQTQFVGEQWTGSEWVNTMNGLFTYDANGNNTESLTQNWENGAWVNFMKLTYNYQPSTDVENKEISIKDFRLLNNYPNPFNPSTKIGFLIPASPAGGSEFGFVSLKVFDVLGNEITTLVNEVKPSGKYQVEFNAADLPSGIYFYKLQAGNFVETKKMLMLK